MDIHKISEKIEVRKSTIIPISGFFAKNNIKRGEILIDIEENNANNSEPVDNNLDKIHHYLLTNVGAFFKHSCNQNIIVEVDKLSKKRFKFKSLENVKQGEELFCNYNTIAWDLGKGFECHCGSKNCIGEVRGMKYLTESEQKKLFPLSIPFVKEKFASKADRIDELGTEVYCKNYADKNMPWEKSARILFNEALDFVFAYKLIKKGKCVEIGVYKGESFLRLVKEFGQSNCLGIDVKNYSNLPCILVQDIKQFNKKIPVKLGINDISWDCPKSKLIAHKWLCKNVVKDGLIILTGYRAFDMGKYHNKNLTIVYQNYHVRVYKKLV